MSGLISRTITIGLTIKIIYFMALNDFSTQGVCHFTSSVPGQGVFDSPSLTLVIGAKNV
jgi:hypothetical protein